MVHPKIFDLIASNNAVMREVAVREAFDEALIENMRREAGIMPEVERRAIEKAQAKRKRRAERNLR